MTMETRTDASPAAPKRRVTIERVEFHPSAQGVNMVVTLDVMHDERWTEMSRMGWESQLGKLAKVLVER